MGLFSEKWDVYNLSYSDLTELVPLTGILATLGCLTLYCCSYGLVYLLAT